MCAATARPRGAFSESGCLGMQPKTGGRLLLKLNMGTRPIANKYREGKMKSTLKRKLRVRETVSREAHGISNGVVEVQVLEGSSRRGADPKDCLSRVSLFRHRTLLLPASTTVRTGGNVLGEGSSLRRVL